MKRAIGWLGLLAAATAPRLVAQSCSLSNPGGTCTVNVAVSPVTIGTILQMTVSTAAVTLTPPLISDFGADSTATITNPSVVTVSASGNVGFHVTLAATTSTWSSIAPPIPKATSDLSWATAVGGPYTPMSTAAATIISSAGPNNGITKTLSYKTTWHFIADPPGVYSLTLT
ncbi:MAG: hypothetical protein ACREOE_18220, partial [Gemmatimonadales bacterium]